MKKYTVWKPVASKEVPPESKIITSIWAMKRNDNENFLPIFNARVYNQVEGVQYDGSTIASPVMNETNIRAIVVLALMDGWLGKIVDLKGVLLHGEFEEDS